MKDTVYDVSYQIFSEISQKEPTKFDFQISDKIEFPILNSLPKWQALIPLPKNVGENFFFQGYIFQDYELESTTIWNLFLASIYHLAAHVNVSDYSIYDKWSKNKTQEICWKVINYIEDINVELFLTENYPEIFKTLSEIDKQLQKTNELSNSNSRGKTNFANFYFTNNVTKLSKLKNKLQTHLKEREYDKVILAANILYKTHLNLPAELPSFYDHRPLTKKKTICKNLEINTTNEFKDNVVKLDELWIKEEIRIKRLFKQYNKYGIDLNFDEITIGSENFGEYLRLTSENSLLIKKVKDQLRRINNVEDDINSYDTGVVDMQKAIQSIASRNPTIKMFDMEMPRRDSENWVIAIDTSASMKLKFDEMKKFALCLSEAANELTFAGGKWGLFTFGSKLQIIKDPDERYSQNVKGRIGAIENSGLSFIPDSIIFGTKMLNNIIGDRKYIFLISDGFSSGYPKIDEEFISAIKFAQNSSINLVGIGITEKVAKYFTPCFSETEFRKTISNFISAYCSLSQHNM